MQNSSLDVLQGHSSNCTGLNRSTAQTVFLALKFLYVFPSAVYLKFLLVALICGRNRSRYSSVFYKLLLIAICSMIVVHVPHSLTEALAKIPSWFCAVYNDLSKPNYGTAIYLFVYDGFELVRLLAASCIAFYRFHAVVDHDSSRIWERRSLPICLFVLLLPFVFVSPLLFNNAYVEIQNDELEFLSEESLSWFSSSVVLLSLCLICSVLIVAVDVYSKCKRGEREEVPVALDRVGVAEAVLVLVYTAVQVLVFVATRREHALSRYMHYVALLSSDALGFAPIWVLFFSSPDIREDSTPFRRIFTATRKYVKGKREVATEEKESYAAPV